MEALVTHDTESGSGSPNFGIRIKKQSELGDEGVGVDMEDDYDEEAELTYFYEKTRVRKRKQKFVSLGRDDSLFTMSLGDYLAETEAQNSNGLHRRSKDKQPLYLLNPDEFTKDPVKQQQIRRAIITYRHHQEKKEIIAKLKDENKKLKAAVVLYRQREERIIEGCSCRKSLEILLTYDPQKLLTPLSPSKLPKVPSVPRTVKQTGRQLLIQKQMVEAGSKVFGQKIEPPSRPPPPPKPVKHQSVLMVRKTLNGPQLVTRNLPSTHPLATSFQNEAKPKPIAQKIKPPKKFKTPLVPVRKWIEKPREVLMQATLDVIERMVARQVQKDRDRIQNSASASASNSPSSMATEAGTSTLENGKSLRSPEQEDSKGCTISSPPKKGEVEHNSENDSDPLTPTSSQKRNAEQAEIGIDTNPSPSQRRSKRTLAIGRPNTADLLKGIVRPASVPVPPQAPPPVAPVPKPPPTSTEISPKLKVVNVSISTTPFKFQPYVADEEKDEFELEYLSPRQFFRWN